MDIQNKTQQALDCARSLLSDKRFAHCVRTGDYASSAAEFFGIDPAVARLAGIVHDICKGMEVTELLCWSQKDGQPVPDIEHANAGLLHGRAAAMYIQEVLDIHDTDIINAVRYHTSGCAHASPLTLLIYCADKVEPGRHYDTEPFRQIGVTRGLYAMALEVAIHVGIFLKKEGKQQAPETTSMIKWLETYETAEHS